MLFNFGKTGNRNKTVDVASPTPDVRDDATLEIASVDADETQENNATEDVCDAASENVNPVGEEINVGDFEPTAPAEAAVVLESAETNAAPENGEETIDVEANENESQTDAPKTDETVAALKELLEIATALRQDFDVKFKFDKKKEEQVDRLYEECKAYRDDIFWSLKKDLILDVVRVDKHRCKTIIYVHAVAEMVALSISQGYRRIQRNRELSFRSFAVLHSVLRRHRTGYDTQCFAFRKARLRRQ